MNPSVMSVIEHCITGDNANDETRCGPVKELYACIRDPFLGDCDDHLPQHYEQAQASRLAFCRTEGNARNTLCVGHNVHRHTCRNHPLSSQCGGFSYRQLREVACAPDPSDTRCADTVVRVCNRNPFSTLCRNTQVYLDARKTQCRSNWNDRRCPDTVREVCGVNPFDRMCNGVYNTPREVACRAGTATTLQCGNTVERVCAGNAFDPLCGNAYTQIRRYACTDNPFAPRCAGDVYNDLRVSFCEGKAGTHSSCPAPEPQVTAKVWADSFDEDLAHGATAEDTDSKFLIGRETDLDSGGRCTFTSS